NLAVEHSRKPQVVRVEGLPSRLLQSVRLAQAPTDDPVFARAGHRGLSAVVGRGSYSSTPRWPEATSTASRILVDPVQRQRFPESACLICCRVGLGFEASRAD